jgi:transcriptional regulator with XRE-family HTH domain
MSKIQIDPPRVVNIEAQIGLTVKRLREAAGLSVRAFADRVAFSASFISQLENGQVSPSIASLDKIAAALNTTINEFFASPDVPDSFVVRANERPSFRSMWSRAEISPLTPMGKLRGPEALIVTLEPGGQSGKHPTPLMYDQFAIVFMGRLELTLADQILALRRGDAAQIPAGTPHRWRNLHRRAAQVVLVSTGLGT